MNQKKKQQNTSVNEDIETKARSLVANYASSDASTFSCSRRFKNQDYNHHLFPINKKENSNNENMAVGNSYYSTKIRDSPVRSPDNRS